MYKKAQSRHLNPSVYKRIRKTENLIQKGMNPEEFRTRGGLDLKTYQALQKRWKDQEQRMEEYKEKIQIKDAPTTGPCKNIEPVVGTKNALVLLCEFKDIKHSLKSEYFKELLFAKGSNRSMRDYYLEASWNKLDIDGDVNREWYSASGRRLDYVDDIPVQGHYPHARELVRETIIQAKNSRNFDFAPFAKDGKIDILIVIYAGEGQDTKLNIKYIRPHKDRLAEPIEVQKGIWADRYCLIPELPAEDVGCFCHEVGHFLGLPDLYKEGYSPVVGSWCLMAIGDHIENGRTPAHPSAWCKVHLGWCKPQILNQLPLEYEIPAVIDDENAVYKIEVFGSGGKEYFLLENRQQKGFDRNLPGNGILIWHVDETVCLAQAPNYDPQHFFLTLIQADGKQELQRDMMVLIKKEGIEVAMKDLKGDTGDAFPGVTVNRTFDDKSNPNSNSYKGNETMVRVKFISDSDDVMKAQMGLQHQAETITTKPIPIEANKSPEFILSQFMTLMTSQKTKTPYDQGYEDGIQDLIEKLKVEENLDSYQEGYRCGYLNEFDKATPKKKR